ELDAKAETAVEEDEGADELAGLVSRLRLPKHPPEDGEQDDAFQESFIELARVAGRPKHALAELVHLHEPNGPGHRRHGAPQFLVHEIGETAEEEAERHAAGDIIVDPEPRQLLLARHVEDAKRSADHAPVEGHAAVPQLQDLERVLQILAEIVEEDVAEAPAEDDAERRIEHQVVGMASGHRRARLPDQLQQVPVADENAGEIGEAVPAQVERADAQRYRGDAEIREREVLGVVGLQRASPSMFSAS